MPRLKPLYIRAVATFAYAGTLLIILAVQGFAKEKGPPLPGQVVGTATVTVRDAYGGGSGITLIIYNSTQTAGEPLPGHKDMEGKWVVKVEGKDYIYSFIVDNPITPQDPYGLSPWPMLYEVDLRSSVTMETDRFIYSYTVYNSTKNSVPVSRIEIDLRIEPSALPLSRVHISSTHSGIQHIRTLATAKRIVPLQIGTPPGWEQVHPGVWAAAGLEDANMIQLGQNRSGFIIVAREPIEIREFAIDGDSLPLLNHTEEYYYPGPEEERSFAVDRGIQYLGKTVAPVAPPDPFTASAWAARMESLAVEARSLSWITSDKQFSKIQDLIRSLNAPDLKKLEKTVAKVEAYVLAEKKAGRLTEEADALVRLNAQYLLRRARENPEVLKR